MPLVSYDGTFGAVPHPGKSLLVPVPRAGGRNQLADYRAVLVLLRTN